MLGPGFSFRELSGRSVSNLMARRCGARLVTTEERSPRYRVVVRAGASGFHRKLAAEAGSSPLTHLVGGSQEQLESMEDSCFEK